MKHKHMLAAAMLVAGLPVAALAHTPSPVTILESDAQPQIADANRPELGSAMVRFVNDATSTVVQVDFTLSSNGEALETFTDKGTFAPGVTINHTFATDQTARDLQVSVADVKFADGTEWVNDAPLPQGQRAVHDWMSNPNAG